MPAANALRRSALGFVVLIGVVSLFADMTYEGARAVRSASISSRDQTWGV